MVEAKTAINQNLEILDDLIARLELLITQAEATLLFITLQDKPKRAIYRPIGNIANSVDRKPKIANAIFLNEERLIIKCTKTELVKLMGVQTTVSGGRNGKGETSFIITGVVQGLKRVRGGYEVEINIDESRRIQVAPGQKLRESLEKGDSASWNRWCRDIRDAIDLTGLNLVNADLAGYDLCCADLTGADLTGADLSNALLAGADLSNTKLDDVRIAGADLFRAKLNRNYGYLIASSGMPEKESVIIANTHPRRDGNT